MSEEMMLQIDHKEKQRRDNYRRAEAFLLWKFGPMYNEAMRFLRSSGMDWPSLFVEFCETVEKDLLERTRIIEEQHFKWMTVKASMELGGCVFRKVEDGE